MATRRVEVPEEILRLLEGSRLADWPESERVRVALAIHLFQEGVVSLGRAAELAGLARTSFESLLIQLSIPTVRYELEDYQEDLRTLDRIERRRPQV